VLHLISRLRRQRLKRRKGNAVLLRAVASNGAVTVRTFYVLTPLANQNSTLCCFEKCKFRPNREAYIAVTASLYYSHHSVPQRGDIILTTTHGGSRALQLLK
jgi:hypothetical protein